MSHTYIMSFLPAAHLSSLAWAVMLLAVDYVAVLACILIACRSGAMRARREGIPRTSSGYRRTVEKASRYFITLIALTVMDLLVVAAVMLLRVTAGSAIPALPLFSTLGALLLCLIEVKSVMENSHRPSDINRAVDSASRLLDDKSLRRLIHTLSELTDSQPKRENKENDNC